MTRRVPAVVLTAPGTNRHADMRFALEEAGADVRFVDVTALPEQSAIVESARLIAVAGGFSYADALGSGRVFAAELMRRIGGLLRERVEGGTPIIGVCNGFQVLVRAGLLPECGPATLAPNANGRFECRWVELQPSSGRCIWTRDLDRVLSMPVAHGEGRFVVDDTTQRRLRDEDRVAFRYVDVDGSPAAGAYPSNPNGSDDDIAGICDESGLILGMMPHPENHVTERQGRSGSRRGTAGLAIDLFRHGVRHVS